MAAAHFEDIQVGDRFHVGTATVSEEEAVAFARRWEPQPHHVDPDAARRSPYGGLTLCSLHLFALCTRLFFDWKERMAVLAMLGKDEIRLPHPARPGEAIRYDTECVDRRESRSRPDRGILTLHDTLSDPAGEPVLTQKVTLLVPRRGG